MHKSANWLADSEIAMYTHTRTRARTVETRADVFQIILRLLVGARDPFAFLMISEKYSSIGSPNFYINFHRRSDKLSQR